MMKCRVGITTNPDKRKAYWEYVYKDLKYWFVLAGPLDSKDEALDAVDRFGQNIQFDAETHIEEVSESTDVQWYVYLLTYQEIGDSDDDFYNARQVVSLIPTHD